MEEIHGDKIEQSMAKLRSLGSDVNNLEQHIDAALVNAMGCALEMSFMSMLKAGDELKDIVGEGAFGEGNGGHQEIYYIVTQELLPELLRQLRGNILTSCECTPPEASERLPEQEILYRRE